MRRLPLACVRACDGGGGVLGSAGGGGGAGAKFRDELRPPRNTVPSVSVAIGGRRGGAFSFLLGEKEPSPRLAPCALLWLCRCGSPAEVPPRSAPPPPAALSPRPVRVWRGAEASCFSAPAPPPVSPPPLLLCCAFGFPLACVAYAKAWSVARPATRQVRKPRRLFLARPGKPPSRQARPAPPQSNAPWLVLASRQARPVVRSRQARQCGSVAGGDGGISRLVVGYPSCSHGPCLSLRRNFGIRGEFFPFGSVASGDGVPVVAFPLPSVARQSGRKARQPGRRGRAGKRQGRKAARLLPSSPRGRVTHQTGRPAFVSQPSRLESQVLAGRFRPLCGKAGGTRPWFPTVYRVLLSGSVRQNLR